MLKRFEECAEPEISGSAAETEQETEHRHQLLLSDVGNDQEQETGGQVRREPLQTGETETPGVHHHAVRDTNC